MILCDVSSSLRVHRSSAESGVRYPFTTSLRGEVGGNDSHTPATTKHTVYCKQVFAVLAGSQKLGYEQVVGQTAYPVNHQKRIFDRKEASFTGQGFWNTVNMDSLLFAL